MSINDYIDGSDYLKIPRPTGQQFSIDQLKALLQDLLRSYTQYDGGPTMPNVKALNQKAPQYLFYLLFKDYLDKLTINDQEQIWSCLPGGNNHRSEAENLAKLVEYFLQSFSVSSHTNSCEFFQKIYYGAPGTGKSYEAKKLTKNHVVFRTTFHPDTDYAAFVGAYKPVPKVVSGTEKISYEFVPQVFTEAYIEAWKQYLASLASKEGEAKGVCLLIEELNRGNCAQIFGDLFQLLDRSKDAFSEYSVLPSAELAQYIRAKISGTAFEAYYNAIRNNSDRTEAGAPCIPAWDSSNPDNNQLRLCLPPNLSIVCTMNTSDQSLFPMDSAFKRRWDWEYVPIQYKCPKSQFTINLDDSHKYDWNVFLKKINGIIYEQTKSEDKQMGNFFVKGDENFEVSCEQFVSKVMFYLWSEICKDNPKARKEIFVAAANQADGTETTEEFTFNDLFSYRKIELLSGFMEHPGIENIALVCGTYDPTETEGESEKDRWEHEIYMEELIAYINNASSTPYSDFKTTFKIPDKPHGNGFVVRPKYGCWISLSRNKDVNLVCYGNDDSKLMEQIFDQYGSEIDTKLGIPKNKDSKRRSESRWMFTDKQGQAKLASPHNLNKEKEYEWFVSKALEMNELFHEYVTKISTI